jgi:hypothetical protein
MNGLESPAVVPFPNIDQINEEAINILKYLIYKIRSETFALAQIMILCIILSKQIQEYCIKNPLIVGTSPVQRREVIMLVNEMTKEVLKVY